MTLEWTAAPIVLFPASAAAIIAMGTAVGTLAGESGERWTRGLSLIAATGSALLLLAVIVFRSLGMLAPHVRYGTWLTAGRHHVDISLSLDTLALSFAALVVVLGCAVIRFSSRYMHREPGFHRFLATIDLFLAAMMLLALSGNGLMAFAGWEVAGVCSFLLIAYAHDRATAVRNATRAFITNRFGDIAFLVGLFLLLYWFGDLEWPKILRNAGKVPALPATALAVCFLLAAMAKSAQVPFTPWVNRAMEGPTPSSALFYGSLMIHAGIFLVLRLEPLFAHAPFAMVCLVVVGATTAIYGVLCGLTQSDVKSSLAFATVSQVGLMFIACGFGWWTLATIHLFTHAVVRGFQLLSAPALMHRVGARPNPEVRGFLARDPRLFAASLNRFWLEPLSDRLVVRTVMRMAADTERLECQVAERIVGLPMPALGSLSTAAAWEEARLAATGGVGPDAREAGGLVRWMAHEIASAFHWFEERLVMRGFGTEIWQSFRRFGQQLHALDAVLCRPRYLILLVLATLLSIN